MSAKHFAFVYVGDYGQTTVSNEVVRSYGMPQFPIDRRSSKQRNALSRLENNIKAMQEHEWIMGRDLQKL